MTEAEKEAKYQEYLKEQKYQEYLASQEPEEEKTIGDYAKTIGSGALTALGSLGSMTRAGVAHATGLSRPEDSLLNAPTTDELLNRAGVGNTALSEVAPMLYAEPGDGGMFTPEKGGMLDFTARGTAGFVGDIALDPLTYLSGGLSAAAKGAKLGATEAKLLKALSLAKEGKLTTAGRVANVVANPLEILSRKGSIAAYDGALNKINSKLDRPISAGEMARMTGFVGNAEQFAQHLERLNKQYGDQIGNVLQTASEKGATVDLTQPFQKALAEAERLRSSGLPEDAAIADKIEAEVTGIYSKNKQVTRTPFLEESADFSPAQSTIDAIDPYHSVEQDKSRVLETITPYPVKVRAVNPDYAVLDNGTGNFIPSPNRPYVNKESFINRKRAFTPLEVDPKIGQADLGFDIPKVTIPQVSYRDVVTNKVPVSKANELKSRLNDFINFNQTEQEAIGNQARKSVATPLSESVKESVKATDNELYDKLMESNKWYASTSPKVQKSAWNFAAQVPQARNPLTPTKVDALAVAVNPLAAIAKKAADIGLSTRGRTATGYALEKAGQESRGLMDAAARQEIWKRVNKGASNDENE